MYMSAPIEDPRVAPIVSVVTALLDDVMNNNAASLVQKLVPDGLLSIGLSLFGLNAVAVPLGLAARPQYLGLTTIQVGEGLAIAEVRGRAQDETEVSVASVLLAEEAGTWTVEDIWPVPAEGDFDVDAILDPTSAFYTGEMQLELSPDAEVDDVESVLIAALQSATVGLHLQEQGVRLWRAFLESNERDERFPPEAWAGGVHLALFSMDGSEPDLEPIAELYEVQPELVAYCFIQLATGLGFAQADESDDSDEPAQGESGLLDASGRPINSRASKDGRTDSGIFLPHA
jgi:hypothetical protein